jgi:D-serine deaminase-like pyridoxal phosphate-dependent protein
VTVVSPLVGAVPVPLAASAVLPLSPLDAALETPALLVDLDLVEANIANMQEFANREGFALRPHVKSHKSLAMTERQLAAGAAGICVATASEAQMMAQSSTPDVLVAYPLVGQPKLQRLESLAGDGRLTLVTDSPQVTEGYRAFARRLGRRIPVLVEVDTGMHRAGADPSAIADLALELERGGELRFDGIMTHAGHAHDVTTQAEIAEVARDEAAVMGSLRGELESLGLDVRVVSAGSTLTAPYLRAGDGVTEIRPGTYIYNDLRTLGRWACTMDEIAAFMLATVVSVHGSRVTLDAGGKTLTSTKDAEWGYGTLVDRTDARFTRMSEEHGVMFIPESEGRMLVGDRVRILPMHVCVWMDLQAEIYGVRGGNVVERIRIDAMRHSL